MSVWKYIHPEGTFPVPAYKSREIGDIEIRIDDHFVSLRLCPYTNNPNAAPFLTLTVARKHYTLLLWFIEEIYPKAFPGKDRYERGPDFARTSYAVKLPERLCLRDLIERISLEGKL